MKSPGRLTASNFYAFGTKGVAGICGVTDKSRKSARRNLAEVLLADLPRRPRHPWLVLSCWARPVTCRIERFRSRAQERCDRFLAAEREKLWRSPKLCLRARRQDETRPEEISWQVKRHHGDG
jgi:hypothetical protein